MKQNIFKRIFESCQNRFWRPWQLKHYQLTPSGRYLASLKGKHEGQDCFLIGNGPSLKVEDLDALCKYGVLSFGFNRIYHIFNQTSWRPDYYLCQDEKMLSLSLEEIRCLNSSIKFLPQQFAWYYGLTDADAHYYNLKFDNSPDGKSNFSADCARLIYCGSTCLYTGCQLAVYMGCKRIYLLGVDHHYSKVIDNNGEVKIDHSVKDYFSENYNKDQDKLYTPNIDKSTQNFHDVKKYTDEHDIHVFNATRGGKLEIFPRTNFDDIINRLKTGKPFGTDERY